MFANFEDLELFLNAKGLFHMDFGLERMHKAIAALTRSSFPIIQVLGTNGKGSTCAFLDSLARSHGLTTGLYTSPHFLSAKERIQVNGHKLDDAIWLKAAQFLAQTVDIAELTYFEFLTVLALEIFNQQKVDLAIMEAGLGGRYDATTALPTACCLYAPIAMDHAAIIGPTLAHIARDKSGAMPESGIAFSAKQFPMAADILEREAEKKQVRLEFVAPLPDSWQANLGLHGKTQLANAALALRCWQWLAKQLKIASSNEAQGLATAFVPGRMQHLPATQSHPEIILDGGHNPHAIQACLRQLPAKPSTIIFSPLSDKDWLPSLAMLGRLDIPIFVPELQNPRAANVELIAAKLPQARAFCGAGALSEALGNAKGLTLIVGSLYLLAHFYELFPQYLEKCEDSKWDTKQ